ncbi:MAG: hypothetical protein J7M19_07620 [Planctomycetes bacterium]|nr:hypothetical protein [Planctomycetota bacterium]
MKKAAILLGVLFLAGACAAPVKQGISSMVLQSDADYDLLWQATLDVVGERFAISRAQKNQGLVETDYLIGALSKTGFKSNAVSGEASLYEMLHTTRRRAVVKLARTGAAAIDICVEMGRLAREHPRTIRGGRFSMSASAGDNQAAWKTRWVDVGPDEQLEATLGAEIEARYRLYKESRSPRTK